MINEKVNQDKRISIFSMIILLFDFLFILNDIAMTFLTRQHFSDIFEQIGPDQLPVISKLLAVSIPTIVYCIFIVSLVLILVLKEIFISAKKITLSINILVGIAAISYIPIYIFALYSPLIKLSQL